MKKRCPSVVCSMSVVILFLAIPVHSEAQAQAMKEPWFLLRDGVSINSIPSQGLFYPGGRIARGVVWKRLDFSLESGLSLLAGENPFGKIFVPLQVTLGYTVPLPKGFGIQPEAGVGVVFHNLPNAPLPPDFLSSLRLKLVWESPVATNASYYRRLCPYIGGGADMIREFGSATATFTPAIETGLTFKLRRRPKARLTPITQTIIALAEKNKEDISKFDYYLSTKIILKKADSTQTLTITGGKGSLQVNYEPEEIVIDKKTPGKGALIKDPRGDHRRDRFEVTFETGADKPYDKLRLFFTKHDNNRWFDFDYTIISPIIEGPNGKEIGNYMVRVVGNDPHLLINYREE